jgi:hypothetical protein
MHAGQGKKKQKIPFMHEKSVLFHAIVIVSKCGFQSRLDKSGLSVILLAQLSRIIGKASGFSAGFIIFGEDIGVLVYVIAA